MFTILILMLLCVTLFTLMKAILYFPSLSVTKKKFLFFQIISFIMIIIVIFYFDIKVSVYYLLLVMFSVFFLKFSNIRRILRLLISNNLILRKGEQTLWTIN